MTFQAAMMFSIAGVIAAGILKYLIMDGRVTWITKIWHEWILLPFAFLLWPITYAYIVYLVLKNVPHFKDKVKAYFKSDSRRLPWAKDRNAGN